MSEEERTLLAETYPSNTKMERPAEKKLEKVISGTATRKKLGIRKRLTDTFLEDNTQSVGDYVLFDILVPAAKSMITDMISGGLEMLLFGSRRGTRTTREGPRSYVNYNSLSYRPLNQTRDMSRSGRERELSRTGRARHDFGEIVLETRGEAEEVLSNLVDLTLDYGTASVADLYDLVGITSNFTDNRYGWTDLRSASVSRVRGGYVINLPRTQQIE